jgi:hypothetical protein
MDRVAQKICALRDQLESAAFLVAQPSEHKAAHKAIVKALILLTELDVARSDTESAKSSGVSNSDEIDKVNRRLKLWAKRPHQINSRILTAYLKLERQGVSPITDEALNAAVGNESSFSSNFLQMRISAEKNHGKVFEQNGEKVTLWPPVIPAVREFEGKVLADTL